MVTIGDYHFPQDLTQALNLWNRMFVISGAFPEIPGAGFHIYETHRELNTNLNKHINLASKASVWKKALSTWFICGLKWLLLNVPQVKGEKTICSIVLPLKWPRPPLYRFPRDCWRPSALQVSTLTSKQPFVLQTHRELFTWLPLNSMPTRQKRTRTVSEHGKLLHAVWHRFVREICKDERG